MSEQRADGSPERMAAAEAELEALFPRVYNELRALAHRHLRGEREGHTLGTTGLVHEAYLKLAALDRMHWVNQSHVLGLAARAMRRILIDYAVSRRTEKRGGGVDFARLDDAMIMADSRGEELIALDEALQRLHTVDPRLSRVVECRFFGGMTEQETAEALHVAVRTVRRDWIKARGLLYQALRADAPHDNPRSTEQPDDQ